MRRILNLERILDPGGLDHERLLVVRVVVPCELELLQSLGRQEDRLFHCCACRGLRREMGLDVCECQTEVDVLLG